MFAYSTSSSCQSRDPSWSNNICPSDVTSVENRRATIIYYDGNIRLRVPRPSSITLQRGRREKGWQTLGAVGRGTTDDVYCLLGTNVDVEVVSCSPISDLRFSVIITTNNNILYMYGRENAEKRFLGKQCVCRFCVEQVPVKTIRAGSRVYETRDTKCLGWGP